MVDFEEKYMDVLQNIEFAIISVYREHSELQDYDVEKVLNALIVFYQAEQQQRSSSQVEFKPVLQDVYERAHTMCEWRLGRERLTSDDLEMEMTPLSLDEIVACLKRVRKSVQRWTKRGGRQGYLLFVNQFIP
jgi:hypothetical protein